MRSSSTSDLQISNRNLNIPGALDGYSVLYSGRQFYVIDVKNNRIPVENYRISKELRGISRKGLENCLSVGYLALKKSGENFSLDFHGRLDGGGWLAIRSKVVKVGVVATVGCFFGGWFITSYVLIAATAAISNIKTKNEKEEELKNYDPGAFYRNKHPVNESSDVDA